MDPPQTPFFSYPSGRHSPYGEQTQVLLQSLAECGGMKCDHYANSFASKYGEGFEGYRDVSTKGFLRNYNAALQPPLTGKIASHVLFISFRGVNAASTIFLYYTCCFFINSMYEQLLY